MDLNAVFSLEAHQFHNGRFPAFNSAWEGRINGVNVSGTVVAHDHLGWDSFVTIETEDGEWVKYYGTGHDDSKGEL